MQTPDTAVTPAPLAREGAARVLPAGTRVQNYEIVRVLHESSAALVYLAIDLDKQAEVALKEYMPTTLARRDGHRLVAPRAELASALARGRRSFIDESKALSHAVHPSLVRVLRVLEDNATVYQVMPYYAGMSLLELRSSMTEPPAESALRDLLDALLGALDAVHRSGRIHGGVAPANIMLREDAQPVLLGPGSATTEVASDLVASLMAAVEPSFSAPEQRSPTPEQPQGPWTDLYALAETVRYCITGVLPAPASGYAGQVPRESTVDSVHGRFDDHTGAGYSASLLDALDAALQMPPGARPQSADEFRALLARGSPRAAASAPAAVSAAVPSAVPTAPRPAAAEPSTRVEPFFDRPVPEWARPPAPAPRAAPPVIAPVRAVGRRIAWAGTALVTLAVLAGVAFGGYRLLRTPAMPIDAVKSLKLPPAAVTSAAPPHAEPPPAVRVAAASAVMRPPAVAASAVLAPVPTPMPASMPAPLPAPVAAPTRIVTAAKPAPTATLTPAPPPVPAVAKASAPGGASSPRAVCGGRTEFALYRCMQAQCAQRAWARHPQCERLRTTDSVE